MYNILNYANHNAGIREYIVDTIKELELLSCLMGSSALVLEDMNLYLKDGEEKWKKVALSSGGGGGQPEPSPDELYEGEVEIK